MHKCLCSAGDGAVVQRRSDAAQARMESRVPVTGGRPPTEHVVCTSLAVLSRRPPGAPLQASARLVPDCHKRP